jgi:putative transposase
VICRLVRENAWGYQRIRGELLKLGIQRSKGCIAAILRRNGLPPLPQRGGLTWRQFLARHAQVLLCADLFTKEVWTCTGLRTAYILSALHLSTRRIVLAEATFSPHGAWMPQMGRNLLMACEDLGVSPQVVVHDRDQLLVHDLDVTLQGAGLEIVKTPFRAPDANAHAERWVRSATGECLDHLILVGLGSLRRTLGCYRDFGDHHRPHQGIGNQIPDRVATGDLPVLPAALVAQRLAVDR